MIHVLLIIGAVLLSGAFLVLLLVSWRKAPTTWDWLKDFSIPLLTPAVVGLVGFWFAIQSEQRAEADRQASLMREIMVGGDRQETSSLIAADEQLRTHLKRYQKCREKSIPTDFDEEAIFFFYGLHRAKLANLHATKGNLIFPRIWMEDAFEALAADVADRISGVPEGDVKADPKVEAVIYEYFSMPAGTNHTISEHTKTLGARPLLLHFHQLVNASKPADPVAAEEVEILKSELRNLQDRLKDEKIKPQELITRIIAMEGIVVYAYNNLFANWYQVHAEKIPEDPPCNAPKEFLTAFQKSEKQQAIRKEAWDLVCKICECNCGPNR